MLNRSTIAISANSPLFTLSNFRSGAAGPPSGTEVTFATVPIVSRRRATRATPHRAVSKW
jgi:hypothetical protein